MLFVDDKNEYTCVVELDSPALARPLVKSITFSEGLFLIIKYIDKKVLNIINYDGMYMYTIEDKHIPAALHTEEEAPTSSQAVSLGVVAAVATVVSMVALVTGSLLVLLIAVRIYRHKATKVCTHT